MRPTSKCLFAGAVLAALIAVGAAVPADAEPLSETAIFIEINDTDGDAGIQIFLDAEGWEQMQVLAPTGRVVLNVIAKGAVGLQGVTELFLESAEPSFDEQPLDEFLALFPEGTYRFRGRTTDGVPLRGAAELTHALPGAPLILSPMEEEVVDPEDFSVEWMTVPDPPGSEIIGYQVIVETDEDPLRVFSADVEADETEIEVPSEFLDDCTAFKAEVLAIEESGNKTISEVEFETGPEPGEVCEDEDDEEEENEEDGE